MPNLIALHSYQSLEDVWTAGVGNWCRDAANAAFEGRQTWVVPANDGQAGWIKRRLLSQGISLFGVQFLDPPGLRRELCDRLGVTVPALGAETLSFLLQTHAARQTSPTETTARPGTCLEALTDLWAAGWLDLAEPPAGLLSADLLGGKPALIESGLWLPNVDRDLRLAARRRRPDAPALSLCVIGWDASRGPLRDLLLAALRAADQAAAFLPLPREPAAELQRNWLSEIEAECRTECRVCPSAGFQSAQASLAGRLEGADLDARNPPAPELLVGVDWVDTLGLVRDFVARWLIEHETRTAPGGEPVRLAILAPRRTASGVAIIRALGAAGIPVEDDLGEMTQPPPERLVQRALLSFCQEDAQVESLLTLIELLNAQPSVAPVWAAVFPLDPVETRRALQEAFADCQHDGARVLTESDAFGRATMAPALRALLSHLLPWPEEMTFPEARERWQKELAGLGLTTEPLEPQWSAAARLEMDGLIPTTAFFQWLEALLGRPSVRRAPEGVNRFARVSVTSLQNAAVQTWGGVVFLDSHEGAWPLYPGENPFLSDNVRRTLNALRVKNHGASGAPECGHLLTSAERAQLEQTQLCELLENCDGPLAFAGPAHDPAEPNTELYPNEWALRCLVESVRGTTQEGGLLDRWRLAARAAASPLPRLPAAEARHLRETVARRCDSQTPFDDYGFNFEALHSADELPLEEAWSARDLEDVTHRPATFALERLFDAQPWRDTATRLARKEGWAVGRLVHRWVKTALSASREARRFHPADWEAARTDRLAAAMTRSRTSLATRLGGDGLPLWWEGVLRKAEWAARRCLDALVEAAASSGQAEQWVIVDKHFSARLTTAGGPLRVQALCDVAVLDRRGFAAAVCHVLDLKTGGQPRGGKPPEGADGLGIGALLLLAREEGAAADSLQVGVIHPEAANLSMIGTGAVEAMAAELAKVAARQRRLIFGQATPANARDFEKGEDLPMATTPIDASVLRAKAGLTDALLLYSERSAAPEPGFYL